MNFGFTSCGQVKYCPSVVDIIDESLDSYIIGCYQLVGEGEDVGLSDDQLVSINQRLGCLVYIESSTVKFEYDCPDGGVFDLKVVQPNREATSNYKCWIAHSNGTIACYDLINETIVLNQRIFSGSSMLCSLTVCDPASGLVIAGDSESKLVAVKKDKLIADYKITNSSEPVWCLNSIQFDTNTFVIFSGSEDSRLRINLLQSGLFSSTSKTIKDFTAGVTSIAIIDNPDRNDEHYQNSDYVVYVGSYDETIRVYLLIISIRENERGERLITQESISLVPLQSIHINDSGIWKMIPIKSDAHWPYILTASMYAGAHIIHKKTILTDLKIDVSSNAKTVHQSYSGSHLVYGVSGTKNCNQIIVTSFYDKSFYQFRRCF